MRHEDTPAVLMTPHRSAFLHLLLVGIPYRFGLLPAGFGHGWLFPDWLVGDRCTLFAQYSNGGGQCSAVEAFAIRDFGVRFLLHYELAWVVSLAMGGRRFRRLRSSSPTRSDTKRALAFHRLLLGSSFATLFYTTFLQHYFEPQFDSGFYSEIVMFYLAAMSVSVWVLQNQSRPTLTPTMKWSIPANALWVGAIINLMVAVASFQILLREGGLRDYYSQWPVTSVTRISLAQATFHTVIHSALLFRVRNFLTMPQLRVLCLYKLLLNIVLPIVWLPDISPHLSGVNPHLTLGLRAVLVATYLFGFLWAGRAEGVSRILSSEKED
jgi:hypothetical protein